jgi:membrane fusion protein, multidrug efflux system
MHKCIVTILLAVGSIAVVWAEEPILSPNVTTLEKQEIRAQLSPLRYTILASELNAKINSINVKEGDHFSSGQKLVRLDCALQGAQLQRAKAVQDFSEKTYIANQQLLALRSVGQLELDTSKAEVDKSRADVLLINTTLQKCDILAPFSGRVAEQKMRAEQYVQAGQPILEILDDSELELEFIVPSHWLRWLTADYPLQVKIDETNEIYPAKITRLGARIDPISQSIKVAAVIDGQFAELIAGMSGRVDLVVPQKNSEGTQFKALSQGAYYDKASSTT